MSNIIVNRPLANTYGWLHVNGTEVEAPEHCTQLACELQPGEDRTVIMTGPAHIDAKLADGAVMKLIQIRGQIDRAEDTSAEQTQINDIRVHCAADARFEWYRVVLDGAATYDNCSVELAGDGSSFAAEIGYRLDGSEKLDINCEAIHTGKKTNSNIHASGVLSGHAFKLLRGTIDLRTGCSGAEGEENEDVLLMDDTVHNQSVPVILCAEEDVVGNHGASIGRLDEGLVFYLESRGIPADAVYDMMARAKLDAVIRRIPDAQVRGQLLGEEDGQS